MRALAARWRREGPGGWDAFGLFFAITLLLYAPAIRAGWMRDTIGWLGVLRRNSFWDYINVPHHAGANRYQLTQIVTWIFYQAIGTSRLGWWLIHTTCFALTTGLLYRVARRLLRDAGVADAGRIALGAALLFCTSPFGTEPVVWKAAWHFLQALLLILFILHLLLRYLHAGKRWMAFTAVVLYAVSTTSLELFYLTPLYAACILAFYQYLFAWDGRRVRLAWQWIGLPLLTVLSLHFLRMSAGIANIVSHASSELGSNAFRHYAVMTPLYALRLLWGRFLPEGWQWAYHKAMCTYAGAGLFYVSLAGIYLAMLLRIRRFSPAGKMAALAAMLLALSMLLALPTWFPEHELIVCDRYAYTLLPFFSLLLAIGLFRLRLGWWPLAAVLLLNVCLTSYLNSLWRRSTRIIEALQTAHPPIDTTKTIILLNNPASLRGAPMFGADISEEWRSMNIQLYGGRLGRSMPEVAAYNMRSVTDGAHVQVLDDSTLTVTLNQPGYWTYGMGFDTAAHHVSPYYTMSRLSQQTYWLRLHGAPEQYVLWYQQGDKYKKVNMAIRVTAQW